MSWVTVIWAVIASACVTMAVIHVLVWLRRQGARAHLLFGLSATGTALFASCEFWMMRAATPEEFGLALRLCHLPAWLLIVSLVGFVRLYLRAGRRWLAWTVCGLRTLALILNFCFTPNLNYREITALEHLPFLGESVSAAVGVPNPWMLVGHLSLLLLVAFVVDAAWSVWRRGDRRQALILGGSIACFTLAGSSEAVIFLWGFVHAPLMTSVFYLGFLVAMGYELSSDLLRAAQLADTLRQREAELSRERALTDAVFDSVPGLLYLYTADGKFVRWNRQHETRTGYTAAEMARMNVADWFGREDAEALRAAWDKVLTGGSVTTELPIKMKDGTRVPYLLTGVRLLIDGQPHLVGIGIDITQRKAIEAEVARQRLELAHLARVASLGVLSGSLAHELNQPLGIILSNAQAAQRLLAQDQADLAEVREILADIVSEDRRAGDIIKRLRALLKRGETLRQSVNVNEAVEEVVRLLRSELIGQGITVNSALARDLPAAAGDRIQLQQVFLNLIVNASEAMKDRPLADRLLTLTTHAEGRLVHVAVRDEGSGLPPEVEALFQPFFSTKVQGLGMGLAICRMIADAHGGRVWAEPNPDRGATFHVTLPTAESAL